MCQCCCECKQLVAFEFPSGLIKIQNSNYLVYRINKWIWWFLGDQLTHFFLMPRQVKITSLSSQNEAYSQKNGLLCCRVTEETDVSGCWRHTVFIKVNVPNNSLIFHLFQWTSVCLYVPGVRYDGQKPEGRSNLIVQLSAEWWGEPPPGSHTHSQQHNELKQTHTFLSF